MGMGMDGVGVGVWVSGLGIMIHRCGEGVSSRATAVLRFLKYACIRYG